MPKNRSKSNARAESLTVEEEQFAAQLKARLRLRRNDKHGAVYHVDLRAKPFAVLGQAKRMLRDPHTIGWPDAGAPTSDLSEAEAWIDSKYARQVLRELKIARAMPKPAAAGPTTVAAGCDTYLVEYSNIPGHSAATYRNRKSYMNSTIKPKLGHLPLAALSDAHVDGLLDNFKVEKVDDETGVRGRVDARERTKRFVRGCLMAAWYAVFPDIKIPFKGTELGGDDAEIARSFRAQIQGGNLKALIKSVFRDDLPQNLRQMLVAALWYDRVKILGKRNMDRRAVANTAAALAFFVAQGFRLEELALLQWFCILEDKGVIIIPGTKSAAGLRAMPLQEQLRPWLALLRELAKPAGAPDDWEPHEDEFVFLTKPGDPQRKGSARSLANRISEALRWAGLKKAGEATHFGRKLLASMVSPKITDDQLKKYLGHASAYKGATQDYLLRMVSAIPPEHQQLVQYLPSPEELESELKAFVPVRRTDIAQRKRRADEARERRASKEKHAAQRMQQLGRRLDTA